jgi:hypothetical protein
MVDTAIQSSLSMETSVIPIAENLRNSMVKAPSLEDLSTDVLILVFEEVCLSGLSYLTAHAKYCIQ